MTAPTKSKDHMYLLVSFVERSETNYRIAHTRDIVSCSIFSLDQVVYFQFEECLATACNVLITSDDMNYLNNELINLVEGYQIPYEAQAILSENPYEKNNQQYGSTDSLNVNMNENEETESEPEPEVGQDDEDVSPNVTKFDQNLYKTLASIEEYWQRVPRSLIIEKVPTMDEEKFFVFGPNRTEIPWRGFRRIVWTSYKSATRTLLRLVFLEESDDSTLSKNLLNNPELYSRRLEDIISIVTERCNASKSQVSDVVTKMVRYEQVRFRYSKIQSRQNRNTHQ